MQKFKILILSLLIGANLQAWDGPIDYLYYVLSGGMAELPSQRAKIQAEYKTPKEKLIEQWAKEKAERKKANDKYEASKKDRENKLKSGFAKRDEKADVLSLVDPESLTPAQIAFLAKQAKIKNAVKPNWYNNLTETEGKVIGYASSENSSEANKLASAEIAKRLTGEISTEDVSKKSEVNGEYQNSFTSEVKLKTDRLNVRNLKTIKTEYVNGVWFTAVEYDGRELSERIISLREKIKVQKQLNYLNNSKLGMKLSKRLGFDPELNLTFNMGTPRLLVGGETYWLSEYELEEFFSRTSTGTVVSSLSKDLYRYGERVDLSITSREQGYVNVFWVTPSGVAGVLRENEVIYNSTLVTENKNRKGIRNKVSDNKELLVTIFSKTPIDVSEFRFKKVVPLETARDYTTQLDAQYNFHKLMELMKEYPHCTSVVNVRPLGDNITFHPSSSQILVDDESGVVYAE